MGKIFVWNLKGCLWNSTQNISPIHWKIWLYTTLKFLELLDLRAHKCFWNGTLVLRPEYHGNPLYLCYKQVPVFLDEGVLLSAQSYQLCTGLSQNCTFHVIAFLCGKRCSYVQYCYHFLTLFSLIGSFCAEQNIKRPHPHQGRDKTALYFQHTKYLSPFDLHSIAIDKLWFSDDDYGFCFR